VLFANFRFYNYPSFLSALSTFSIFVLISLLFLIVNLESPAFSIFFDLLISSPFSSFVLSLILLFGSFLLILNRNYFSTRNLFQYEFDILLNFSFLGLVILCLSNDFLVVYTAIELQSLAFYILAAFRRDSEFSNEAGIKYFVLGSFSSCFLLLGFSLVYFSMGSTSFDSLAGLLEDSNILLGFIAFIFIVVALFFKLGAAPFHM
jgi:NADH-quinone oxidoreductase subunit N